MLLLESLLPTHNLSLFFLSPAQPVHHCHALCSATVTLSVSDGQSKQRVIVTTAICRTILSCHNLIKG